VLYLPFWVSVLLGLFGIIKFPWFFEGVLAFLLSDLLYGAHELRFSGIIYISFLISFLILICWELLKKQLKFYD
jgi:hypothetical protein